MRHFIPIITTRSKIIQKGAEYWGIFVFDAHGSSFYEGVVLLWGVPTGWRRGNISPDINSIDLRRQLVAARGVMARLVIFAAIGYS